jgi:cysteinyl-tRNA synthetase
VLKDDDQPKMKAILDWARAEGREKEISPELLDIAGSAQLADEQVNRKLAEMEAARKARNFKTSDALRAELTALASSWRTQKTACAGEESKSGLGNL